MAGFENVVAALNSPALALWDCPVTWAEVLGDITGAACVWLVARENVWTWPLGLLNNVFWCLLFWEAKLYADAVLQVAFFALGVYGWRVWTTGARERLARMRVRRTEGREWASLAVVCATCTGLTAYFLARHTPSPAPLADASVLTLSLAATYGQAQKLLESWWIWIAVDVVSVPLYVSRALYPTALIYVLFGCLCVKGLREWTRAARENGGDVA